MIVIERYLADRTRERRRQFAARIRVAKKYIGDRRSAHRSRVPCFEYRRRILSQPIDRQRPAVFQNDSVRFAGRVDRFDEIELAARQIDVRSRPGLAADVAYLADNDDSKIRRLCRVDRLVKFAVVVARQVTSGFETNFRRADLLLNALEDRDRIFWFAVAGPPVERIRFVAGQCADDGNAFGYFCRSAACCDRF